MHFAWNEKEFMCQAGNHTRNGSFQTIISQLCNTSTIHLLAALLACTIIIRPQVNWIFVYYYYSSSLSRIIHLSIHT